MDGLKGALQTIFESRAEAEMENAAASVRPSALLIRQHEQEIMASVFCWTGHFPERTRQLLRHIDRQVAEMRLVYKHNEETTVLIAFTAFITSLALNYMRHNRYVL